MWLRLLRDALYTCTHALMLAKEDNCATEKFVSFGLPLNELLIVRETQLLVSDCVCTHVLV